MKISTKECRRTTALELYLLAMQQEADKLVGSPCDKRLQACAQQVNAKEGEKEEDVLIGDATISTDPQSSKIDYSDDHIEKQDAAEFQGGCSIRCPKQHTCDDITVLDNHGPKSDAEDKEAEEEDNDDEEDNDNYWSLTSELDNKKEENDIDDNEDEYQKDDNNHNYKGELYNNDKDNNDSLEGGKYHVPSLPAAKEHVKRHIQIVHQPNTDGITEANAIHQLKSGTRI